MRALVLSILVLAGCASTRSPSTLLAALPAERAQAVRAMNDFTFELYAARKDASVNSVISPASVYWALLLLEPGARGQTAAQLRRALHAPENADALHSGASALTRDLLQSNSQVLRVGNALFTEREGFDIDSAFVDAARDRYRAEIEQLDFRNHSPEAREHINEWVGKQTTGKIQQLLPPGSPSADTRVMLVNAVAFSAKWAIGFDEANRLPKDFTDGEGKTLHVPTMRAAAYFLYSDSGPVRVLELPYDDSTVVLDVLLPKAQQGLADLESSLDAAHLDRWLGGLAQTEVRLELPRFNVRSRPEVMGALQQLGVVDAFTRGANLEGIAAAPTRLWVSAVAHEAMVEITEKGTEAAAATAIDVAEITSAHEPTPRPEPIEFKVDHPFMFLLRDRTTQQVLFVGRIANPLEIGGSPQ